MTTSKKLVDEYRSKITPFTLDFISRYRPPDISDEEWESIINAAILKAFDHA